MKESKVVPFPKTFELKELDDSNSADKRIDLSSRALTNLEAHMGKLIPSDRNNMAYNFHQIIKKYGVRPRHIKKFSKYKNESALRRDLSRMQLDFVENYSKKNIIASTPSWISMLNVVSAVLQDKGEQIRLEDLAEMLVRNTRFHPVSNTKNSINKLYELLNLLAIKVNQEEGLKASFKRIAQARVQHLLRYRRDIDEICPNQIITLDKTLLQYFSESNIPASLKHKRFSEFNEEDWNVFESQFWYDASSNIRNNVEKAKDMLNYKKTLIDEFQCPHMAHELYYLPRYYIGYRVGWGDGNSGNRVILPDSEEHKWILDGRKEAHRPIDSYDELNARVCNSFEDIRYGASYLVLYPDNGLRSIIPWIFIYDEEGSLMIPLNEHACNEYFFSKTIKHDEPIVGQTLFEVIEDDLENVMNELRSTSKHLMHHPYYDWENKRISRIDTYLNALLTD